MTPTAKPKAKGKATAKGKAKAKGKASGSIAVSCVLLLHLIRPASSGEIRLSAAALSAATAALRTAFRLTTSKDATQPTRIPLFKQSMATKTLFGMLLGSSA